MHGILGEARGQLEGLAPLYQLVLGVKLMSTFTGLNRRTSPKADIPGSFIHACSQQQAQDFSINTKWMNAHYMTVTQRVFSSSENRKRPS